MHFPRELLDVSKFNQPVEKTLGKAEVQMAEQLIESMTTALAKLHLRQRLRQERCRRPLA